MQENIYDFIESLFEHTPRTKGSVELQEELYANAVERYQDAIEQGISEEDAFQRVTSSIGNIDDLLAQVVFEETSLWTREEIIDNRKRRAVLNGIIAGLYVIVVFILGATALRYVEQEGYLIALVVSALPIGLQMYTRTRYPAYEQHNDSIVGSFQEWNRNDKQKKSIQGQMIALIWVLTVVVYFVVSFTTGAWYMTWLIFLVGVCAQMIAQMIFKLR